MASNNFWWKAESIRVHDDVFAFLRKLEERQHHITHNNLRYLRLYSNFRHLGFTPHQKVIPQSELNVKHRITLNIIQAMCDTVQSRITKGSPRVRFLTSGGNFRLKRRAEKLTKFIDGQFALTEFNDKAAMAFLDAAIFGTGVIKLYTEDEQIKADRVFIQELKIDETESIYGKPRQIHQVKYIHKEVLKEMFPKAAGMIESIKSDRLHFHQGARISDMVEVVESWHLRSSSKSKDGRHSITIENFTLHDESYEKDYFPFVFFKWGVRPVGFFGQGLAEQLQGIQLELNKILRTIQISMHLTSIPKVFVENASKVITAHLNNEIGGIIKYTGVKPSYESVGAVPIELFTHLDRLYQRAFEVAGISQLSAASLKPSGLDSGKALREFNDIESERFLAVARRYEKSYMDAAKMMIDMAKDLYAGKEDISFKVKGDQFLETIHWEEIDLEDDQYLMDRYPTNALSQSPSGRLQDVQELVASGLVNPVDGKRLLQFPDLESIQNLENAAILNIERTIEKMLDTGEYTPPEPFQDLQLGMKKMQESYLLFQHEGVEDETLELFRQWMTDAEALLQRAAQAVQMQQAQAMGAAQGAAVGAQQVAQAQGQAQQAQQLDAAQLSDPEELAALEAGILPEAATDLPV